MDKMKKARLETGNGVTENSQEEKRTKKLSVRVGGGKEATEGGRQGTA